MKKIGKNFEVDSSLINKIVNRKDQCVLMVQSPFVLFCYWEFSNGKKELVEHHLNGQWSLFVKKITVYDITGISFNGHNAHVYQQFVLPNNCKRWFFYGLTPNRTYCVDIGVMTCENTFFSVARTNSVQTPRVTYDNGVCKSTSSWIKNKTSNPEWEKGFSSYSYYENL